MGRKVEYVTFGQQHTHEVDGHTLDHNTVAMVNDRQHAFTLFETKFCTSYPESEWDHDHYMTFYPGGYVDLRTNL